MFTDTSQRGPIRLALAEDRKDHVYIAGPMTGLPNYNFETFNALAEKLRGYGLKVHNPADHGLVDGATREDYLRFDVAELAQCEHVYFLPGWENSPGARLEFDLAQKLGLSIAYYHPATDTISVEIKHEIYRTK